ncbi:hypothetical protein [Streptomyces sp. AC495_CC817]|uniref:hypothetical protein n=1 Tax=Streptomyces sp. AC495_CC817 TaxID=2823900 RepID=UPI001C277727|nr:hypothetical protein [Streptomyces sp. AC495_CC817]
MRSPSPARWLQPSGAVDDEPRWGHPDGLQIGIPPLPGPRGLLRVFAPYLDHPRERLVNFVAVEPIVDGATERGFSELEPSTLDPGERGMRLWSADSAEAAEAAEQRVEAPARGVEASVDGVETLTVWIGVERFDSGADVKVRVRFRSDRPHEVELAGFANAASARLSHLILTATMGNWARLRRLHLADRDVTAAELWPGFSGTGFAPHARFPLSALRRDGDAAVVTATGDELDPWSVSYSDDTADHWRFLGAKTVQGWRTDDPHPELEALVNARWSYWASASPIPGGPAYENVEMVEPFRQGAAFRFSVEPDGA